MGQRKDVIIVIPGTKALVAWPGPVQFIARGFAGIFGLHWVLKDSPRYLHGELDSKRMKIKWLHWSRGVSAVSRWFGKRRLKRLLLKYKDRVVKIVGISMAGDLILDVFEENYYENVKKIILIGSVNTERIIDFRHPPIVNIYSRKDDISKFAIKMLAPFSGGRVLKGKNVKNIRIPLFTHKDFCYNCSVEKGKYKGKKISDIVEQFLKD